MSRRNYIITGAPDYNDILHHSLPEYLTARLHRVQNAAAHFVIGKYATTRDILKLNWLPVTEQREWHILKSTHKSLYSSDWPNYLRLETYENNRIETYAPARVYTFKDQ